MNDPVKNPAHYQHGGIETIDIIRTMLTPEEFIGYCSIHRIFHWRTWRVIQVPIRIDWQTSLYA